jgi:hypothetical protein
MEKLTYPKTIVEFTSRFQSDEVCLKYLIESRAGWIYLPTLQSKGWLVVGKICAI